jgi:hypothetical protein
MIAIKMIMIRTIAFLALQGKPRGVWRPPILNV